VLELLESNQNIIGYLSSYPPRECGIATFTKDLIDATTEISNLSPVVIAVNDKHANYDYDCRVKIKINRDYLQDYKRAAEYINSSDIDLVLMQHEFGLFGGEYGDYLKVFLDNLNKPIITTLHTVLPDFNKKALEILNCISEKSEAIVVISHAAISMLKKQAVPFKKCVVIPHGCPSINISSNSAAKKELAIEDHIVASTFGLINRGKGIEYVIDALPEVIKREPRLIYFVIGETHPEVRKTEGEQYRNELKKKARDLGIESYVRFTNRYLTRYELIKYLQATDIYLTPYVSPNQISSGALIYALGAGKAVISTPYFHAKEALANQRGILCEFRDAHSISKSMIKLLDEDLREKIQMRAYNYSRKFLWKNVAMKYSALISEIIKPVKCS
jgi:polysaccharide biosynthesis protein PslF